MSDGKTLAQTVAGFFRVFDIAFFLPGLVLLLGLAELELAGRSVEQWFSSVGRGVQAVALSFILGLLCHTAARLLRRFTPQWFEDVVDWLFDRGEAEARSYGATSEVPLYLWNLASLSWNLAVAFGALAIIAGAKQGWGWWVWAPAVAGIVLTLQGWEFRRGADSWRP